MELQPEEYTSDRLREKRLQAQIRTARISSKIKQAMLQGGGAGGRQGDSATEQASWGFDDDAEMDEDEDEDENDDDDDDDDGSGDGCVLARRKGYACCAASRLLHDKTTHCTKTTWLCVERCRCGGWLGANVGTATEG